MFMTLFKYQNQIRNYIHQCSNELVALPNEDT